MPKAVGLKVTVTVPLAVLSVVLSNDVGLIENTPFSSVSVTETLPLRYSPETSKVPVTGVPTSVFKVNSVGSAARLGSCAVPVRLIVTVWA